VGHSSRGWPTFAFFVKVGTTRPDATAFLCKQSELCFRRRGPRANQSVSRGEDKNPDASCISPHLYKERKGGPAPYEIVDYNGDPVQGSFGMSEDLTRLWTSGQAGPPNPNSWPENGPLFTDWIGFQGNFTPSSQAYFMNWQSFSTNWGNAGWYHLSTQIIQVANMIDGLLTTAEPTVIWP
jgi:hypothetical protein